MKPNPTPFAQFQDFARKVLRVPKSEINARAKAEQEAKLRKPRKAG